MDIKYQLRSESGKFFFASSQQCRSPPPHVPRFIPLHLSLILMCCQPWNSTSLKVERIRVWRVNTSESQSKGLRKMLTFATPFWCFSPLRRWGPSRHRNVRLTVNRRKSGNISGRHFISTCSELNPGAPYSEVLSGHLHNNGTAECTNTSGAAPLHHCCGWTSLFPSGWRGHQSAVLHPRVALFCNARTTVLATFTRDFVPIRDDFKASAISSPVSAPFLCSASNAAWCLNGRCSPSCNTRAPTGICSIQQLDGSEGRRMEMATEDSATGRQSACVRASPLLSFDRTAEMLRLFQHDAPTRR